uniref:Uncharacterized protein n=1 Tax=Thermofilum pendens TaxID=2269 RepID=A0A7C4BAE2_THEPE
MRLRYLAAFLIAAVCAAALAFYYYPRFVKAGGPPLEERFRELYSSDTAFRSAVDELRAMVLDPQVPFDRERALQLFNTILGRLGLPAMDPVHFGYGKAVAGRAEELPEPVECLVPRELRLVVMQPKPDVDAGNGLERVYACEYEVGGKRVVEVTLVFRNERSPSGTLQDAWYEAWRLVAWGRSRDIETFFLVLEGGRVYADFSGFALVLRDTMGLRLVKGIGSGAKTFGESAHEEERVEVPGLDLIIYVNTYNHALGLRDNNPGVEKARFMFTPGNIDVGRRMHAENEYSDLKYSGELVRV